MTCIRNWCSNSRGRGNRQQVKGTDCDMADIEQLLANNREWASRIEREEPGFFQQLSQQQSPEYLWIGCSDSRVPANQIIDMAPGEVFVHRNVANVVSHSDLNCLSVLQFAVDVLKVKHVLVVGHYGCGGVEAALNNRRVGLADNWLRHVADLRDEHTDLFGPDLGFTPTMRHDLLCEINALEQALNVAQTTVLNDAWSRGQSVTVHAWVYSLNNGRVTDLGLAVDSADSTDERYRSALQGIHRRSLHIGK